MCHSPGLLLPSPGGWPAETSLGPAPGDGGGGVSGTQRRDPFLCSSSEAATSLGFILVCKRPFTLPKDFSALFEAAREGSRLQGSKEKRKATLRAACEFGLPLMAVKATTSC